MRSGTIPSLIHHTASRDNPASAVEAKGAPLSVRIARGKCVLAERRFEDRLHPRRVRAALRPVPPQPYIPGLARDPEARAQLPLIVCSSFS
jgi:hypothetical protein